MVYTDVDAVPRSAFLAGAAAAVLVVASFLPWVVEGAETFSGLDEAVRDGYLAVGVAVAVVATVVGLEWSRLARAAAALGGVGATAVAVHWYLELSSVGAVGPGAGVHLALVGGIGLVAAAGWGEYEARRRGGDADGRIGSVEGDGEEHSA